MTPPATVRLSHQAMACVFEILLPTMPAPPAGAAGASGRDAAVAAFAEVDRLERVLSRFHAYSDVSRLNAAPAGEWVVLEIETFECLSIGRRMWAETAGAFDVTAAVPAEARPALAGEGTPLGRRVDMSLLELDESAMSARRLDGGVRVDFGGIGKGYALDRLAELLKEWGVEAALLHSGTSTVLGFGAPQGRDCWRVALRDPLDEAGAPLGWVDLRDEAFSGSSTAHARHIADPRTGLAVAGDRAAWAKAPTAAEADAMTTALCVMDYAEAREYSRRQVGRSCLAAWRQAGRWRIEPFGPAILVGDGAGNRG